MRHEHSHRSHLPGHAEETRGGRPSHTFTTVTCRDLSRQPDTHTMRMLDTSEPTSQHDYYAGHSVEMFLQKVWGALIFSIPTAGVRRPEQSC